MRRTVVPNLSRDANTDDGFVFQYIVKEKVYGWAIVGCFRGHLRVSGESERGVRGGW